MRNILITIKFLLGFLNFITDCIKNSGTKQKINLEPFFIFIDETDTNLSNKQF